MRRKLIAGNWKMNLHRAEASDLARHVVQATTDLSDVDVLLCPPSVYLQCVGEVLLGSKVLLGGQNAYFELAGAFTGEVSPSMLVDLGCSHVILGHSERRWILGETSTDVSKKAQAALAKDLVPIICLGESLEQREAGLTLSIIEQQLLESCAGLTDPQLRRSVIAYEPIWAIGTGKVATPEQAQEAHAALRKIVRNVYNPQVADGVRILYGGSVKASNARDLLDRPDIDGALVGGASLVAESFIAIALAATNKP